MNIVDKLVAASRHNNSLLCIGLDPDPSQIPEGVDIVQFVCRIVEATCDLVCAYKINFAFFEALGEKGYYGLEAARAHIPADVPSIADAKRGDIGNTSKAYARAIFDQLNFDAVTVNPYMGGDSIQPFIDYAQRGVFILCRTSNKGAEDFQSLVCSNREGRQMPLYQQVAQKAAEWNLKGNIGLVVGATAPNELSIIRQAHPMLPILIPGIGSQGGSLEKAVRLGFNPEGGMAIINSSRQIIHASGGADFAQHARRVAMGMKNDINSIRQSMVKS